MHAKLMSKPWLFYHALKRSQLCSTDPDVDFKNLFESGKYVCVTLPWLVGEDEGFRLLSTVLDELLKPTHFGFRSCLNPWNAFKKGRLQGQHPNS